MIEKEKIANRIRTARANKQHTIATMAEALGMSPSGYSKIERAETSPTIDKIQEIALLLGIDMMTLIAENEVQKNEPSDELKEIKEQYRKLENMLAIIVKEVNTLKKKMQEQEQE